MNLSLDSLRDPLGFATAYTAVDAAHRATILPSRVVTVAGITIYDRLYTSLRARELLGQTVLVDDLGVAGTEELLLRQLDGTPLFTVDMAGRIRRPGMTPVQQRFERRLRNAMKQSASPTP